MPETKQLEASIACRLRKERKDRGLTLQNIAELAGTSAQTIQRLETGNMMLSVYWVEKICEALGIVPATLFSTKTTVLSEVKAELRALRILTQEYFDKIDILDETLRQEKADD